MASFLGVLGPRLKQASLLWLHGFRDACCLHRVLIYCFSIFIVNSIVIPTLQWILPDQCPHSGSQKLCSSGGILKLYSFLRLGLLQLFYVFGFYPLYVFSFILSNLWYSDVAKYGFLVIGKYGPTFAKMPIQPELLSSSNATQMDQRTDIGGVVIGIDEQVYSVLLLSFFFLEVQMDFLWIEFGQKAWLL